MGHHGHARTGPGQIPVRARSNPVILSYGAAIWVVGKSSLKIISLVLFKTFRFNYIKVKYISLLLPLTKVNRTEGPLIRIRFVSNYCIILRGGITAAILCVTVVPIGHQLQPITAWGPNITIISWLPIHNYHPLTLKSSISTVLDDHVTSWWKVYCDWLRIKHPAIYWARNRKEDTVVGVLLTVYKGEELPFVTVPENVYIPYVRTA